MADGVEAELKVAVDAAGASRVARLAALPGLTITAKGDKRLVSTYFDTPDLALRAKGISLRLRRSGRSGEQTVKFSGSFLARTCRAAGIQRALRRPGAGSLAPARRGGRRTDQARRRPAAGAAVFHAGDAAALGDCHPWRRIASRWRSTGARRRPAAGAPTSGRWNSSCSPATGGCCSRWRGRRWPASPSISRRRAKSDLGYALLEGEIGAIEPTTAVDADSRRRHVGGDGAAIGAEILRRADFRQCRGSQGGRRSRGAPISCASGCGASGRR